jgi:hypothetical protein
MRQIPGLQAAWSAGVTVNGAPSSAGAAAGGALGVEAVRRARTRAGLTGATAGRGAVRRTAARVAAAARGLVRRVLRRVAALRAVRFGAARRAAARRLGLRAGSADAAADLRLARGAAFFATLDPGLSFWARRARFQTLRAAAECLRARLASRLASFRRLRARFSSSLAMRTRCLATSACSRARSRGSAGVSCSLPVFFIGGLATRKTRSVTQARDGCHRGDLSTEFVHNHVDRSPARAQTLSPGKGLRHDERVFASVVPVARCALHVAWTRSELSSSAMRRATGTRCKTREHYMIAVWTRLPSRATAARSWHPCG